ncbi:MAG: Fur family transcriptional regulator [Acidobacteriota bacterium]
MAFPELDRFVKLLRQKGHRVTPERLQLFREIYEQHTHIDADELLRSMKERGRKISRATLYRNLDLMARFGFVEKRRLGGNRFLYEHVHFGMRHDHLVCMACGRVVEFVSPSIEVLQREICRAHGFDPDQHTLQIHSRCEACREEESRAENAENAESAAAAGA